MRRASLWAGGARAFTVGLGVILAVMLGSAATVLPLSGTASAQETSTQEPDQFRSEQSAAAVQQPPFNPDPDRPAQPPGRPTLVDPFNPVAGQYPYVSNPYGGTDTHSDEFYNSYYALDFGLNGRSFPVAAAAGGTLTYLTNNEAGNTVFINHGNGWKTKYAHLSEGGVTVRGQTIQKGESIKVSAGEVFANSGKTGTGRCDCIHLHFELRATYWPGSPEEPGQRTGWNTWTYPLTELYGQSAEVYKHISDTKPSEEFIAEDPALINNPIGNDTVSSLDVPRALRGDLADQQVVSLYEHTYYSFGRCEEFRTDDPDLRDNHIGNDTVSSIRVGVPCPSAATPAPNSLSVKALNPTSIELRWSAPATTPTGYAVYEAEKSLKAIVRGTDPNSHTISGLQPGSRHCYYVYAFYTAGSSEIQWGCAKTPTS
jgi:murein DD-endopeptidase MepM/ murein hydrolase activator NlpD